MRVVYSCVIGLSLYIYNRSFQKSLIWCISAFLLHIPIPFNAENFVAIYFLCLYWRFESIIGWFKLKFGIYKSDLERRRLVIKTFKPDLVKGVEMEVENRENYELFIFKPKVLKSSGAVIFFHGGGFVTCHVTNYQRFLSFMAADLGCVVFAPNYRKAPEHPWPECDLDGVDSARFVFTNADRFGIDRDRIVLSGDSAGGYMAVVTWFRLRKFFDEIKSHPVLISLIYPGLGYRFDTPSMERNGDVPLLPKSEAMYYYFQHAGWDVCETKLNLAQVNMHIDDNINEINENLDPKKWLDPQELEDWSPPPSKTRIFSKEELEFRERATRQLSDSTFVPLNWSDETLLTIPPVITYVSEHDVLKNDGQMFHNRLKHLGKSSTLVVMDGAFHGQFMFSSQFSGTNLFKRTTARCTKYIKQIGNYLHPRGYESLVLNL